MNPGLLGLEKELQCSICTEVLYQPLTLLDCLHTFCGSCLKEWFSWQAQRHKNSSSSVPGANPYTCPSCRASVRETRPNATVTTLLEMFLKANPSRDRSASEKEEIAKQYKVGDVVIPKIEGPRRRSRDERRAERQAEAEEDRRLMDEVMERSRTEISARRTAHSRLEPGPASSGERSRSREQREREERHRRRREEERRRRRATESAETRAERVAATSVPSSQAVRDADHRQRERQIEHQSSLRSLMSASTDGEGAMEEEILRQIIDENLLEGVNLDDLDSAQQDELSERIAEAYRQRHPSRRLPNLSSSRTDPRDRRQRSHSAQSGNRANSRPVTASGDARHPPVSRPHFLEASDVPTTVEPISHHRRSASDQGRRQTSPVPATQRTNSEERATQQATRSATDLSLRPRTSDTTRTRPRHPSDVRRTTTEPEAPRITDIWRNVGLRDDHRNGLSQGNTESPQHLSPTIEQSGPVMASTITELPATNETPVQPLLESRVDVIPTQAHELSGTENIGSARFLEPSVSCDRCAKPSIQYMSFKHCSKCSMNVCIQCYRQKRGCRHWFGFAKSAMINFATSAPHSPNTPKPEPPHVLVGRKYLPPPSDVALRTEIDQSSGTSKTFTSSDPNSRLQEGQFCDHCHEFANACHWQCGTCNEEEWGYCNECVNTHHCCSHPLLPLAHKKFAPGLDRNIGIGGPRRSSIPSHASILPIPGVPSRPSSSEGPAELEGSISMTSQEVESDWLPLTFTTHCDLCHYPIPPSSTRFHCPFHEPSSSDSEKGKGDFDICTSCYTSLAKTGAISAFNGINGWRRCPKGHRMIVTGFEERGDGQRRVIVKDLVGGWALRDEYLETGVEMSRGVDSGVWSWRDGPDGSATMRASRSKSNSSSSPTPFPPSGGIGLHCQALWSYLPDHEADPSTKDELLFPRSAEIREVEDINKDWFWGVYMGEKGVFPGGYVRVIGAVGM